MATRQVVIDVPGKVLLAEKTDEISFSRELKTLAAVKLYELGRLSSGIAAEVAGEALERMTPEGGETCVRVVCNSCLNPLDVQTAQRPSGECTDNGVLTASRVGGRWFVTNGLVAARVKPCSRSCRKLLCQKCGHELPHRLRQDFWMRAKVSLD
jgi:hypothetical protein